MATFMLVHGGGHGGWCYNRLSPLLREAGHLVYSPSLTGLGDRKHLLDPAIDLDTHITDVVNLIAYNDLKDVILLGHSYGGMVITGVADRIGASIGHLVYLDAAHPKNGESLADVAAPMMAMTQAELRVVDGVELVLWPDSQAVQHYGVTDPADFAWLKSKLTPHPWKCFTQKLVLQDAAAVRRIPTTNICCTAGLQAPGYREEMQTAQHFFEIDTGHDLMITEPRAVADMLLKVAAG